MPAELASPNWEGDGSTETTPDDGEWGGDAPARKQQRWATTTKPTPPSWRAATSRCNRFCTGRRCRCACPKNDRAALRFLIESLNDDGYLEDSCRRWPPAWPGDDLEQQEELVHRFTVALGLLQSLDPPAWARATWPNA
jgi:RNA polymerase sigma-54 factor